MLKKLFFSLTILLFSLQAAAHDGSYVHSHFWEVLALFILLLSTPWLYRTIKNYIKVQFPIE